MPARHLIGLSIVKNKLLERNISQKINIYVHETNFESSVVPDTN